MDGVSHYVTVRRDLFTGLVASATSIPVTTLAITKKKHNTVSCLIISIA